MVRDAQNNLIVYLSYANTIGKISMAAASLVLIILLAIGLYRPKLVNRVSLRLQAAVALVDILFVWSSLEYTKNHVDSICAFIGFTNFFLRHMYCFINISIAINLQLVFLQKRDPTRKWELFYWVGSLGLAFLLDIPLYALNYFGYDGSRYCIIRKEFNGPFYQNVMINTILLLTFLYCFVVVTLVIVKLNREIIALDTNPTEIEESVSQTRSQLQKFIKKLTHRVALYLVVCIVSQLGYLSSTFYKLVVGTTLPELVIWSAYGSASTGLLNFIAFMFDPSLHIALSCCYKSLISNSINNQSKTVVELELRKPHDNDKNHDLFGYEDEELTGEKLLKETSLY